MRRSLLFGFLLVSILCGCNRHEEDSHVPASTPPLISKLRSLNDIAEALRMENRAAIDRAIIALRSGDLVLLETAKAELMAVQESIQAFECELWQLGLEPENIDELMRGLPRLKDWDHLENPQPQIEDIIKSHPNQ